MESTHHPEDGLLQAYLDGELPEGERSTVHAHVRSCLECTRSVEELRTAADAVHDWVVRETPDRVADPVVPHPAFTRARRRRPAARSLVRAAGLVLALVGSAAVLEATTGWLGAAVRALRGDHVEAPAATPAPAESLLPEALFTVQPRSGTLEVLLEDLAPGTRVTVRLGSADVGEVRIGDAVEGVTYRAGPGSATAVAPGVDAVDVVLPRALRSGRVVVNGQTAVVKAAERLFSVRDADEFEGGFRFRVER